MKQLFIEDLEGKTEDEILQHLLEEWEARQEEVNRFNILIGYESVGSWGCDSSAFYLLRDKTTGKLYEVHGSHCSCYGFEGQFSPEETTLEYLKSDKFNFCCGGYDGAEEKNQDAVRQYIAGLEI
jgi:hypothetical protein